MKLCRQYQGMEPHKGGFLVHTDCADIWVCFVTPEIVRVRVAFDRKLEEESYVLATTAWADRLDPLFGDSRTRVEPVAPRVEEDGDSIRFSTGAVRLELGKDPLGFRLYNAAGDLLTPTWRAPPTPWIPTGASPTTAAWRRTTASTASGRRPAR